MNNDYVGSLDSALALADPTDTVESVKSVVSAELSALDSGMCIRWTDYFNHSFVPDLVATWPKSDRPDRYIYLKFNHELGHLFDDLSLVVDKQPIVFGLTATPRGNGDGTVRIARKSQDTDTLVTDAAGIETVLDARSNDFLRLVAGAVAHGGRGLLDRPAAQDVTRSVAHGFDGARLTEPVPTRRAVDALDTVLNPATAGRMVRLLQAVWVGSGGHIDTFPGRPEAGDGISDEALEFLLCLEEIPDANFWDRIGREVPIAQLTRVNLPAGSTNLDHLMRVNADRYAARSCRVHVEAPDPAETTDLAGVPGRTHRTGTSWSVERRLLALRGDLFTAYIAEHVDDLRRSPYAPKRDGIPLGELMRRAQHLVLSELDLASAGRTVRYSTAERSGVLRDATLGVLLHGLGEDAAVRRTAVVLDKGRVSCDFQTRTVTSRTNSTVGLPDLLLVAIHLFADTTDHETDHVRRLIQATDVSPSPEP
jgi:hypothetical protein